MTGPEPGERTFPPQLAVANLRDPRSLSSRHSVLACSLLLIVYLAIAILEQTSLYADGAFYLTWILEHQAALDIDRGRHFAHVVTQAPIVAALQVGLTDLSALTTLFGVGLFGHFAISLVVCRLAAGSSSELLFFPLASFFAVTANSAFFIVSESHLLVSLFWALVFVLVLPQTWTGRWLALAALLALPTLRIYETMAPLGLILATAAAWRASTVRSTPLRLGAVAIALWCLAGTAVAAYGIVNPRVPTNRASFLKSLVPVSDHLGHLHGMVVLSLAALGLIALVLMRQRFRSYHPGIAVLLLTSLAWAVLPLLKPDTVAPFLHYRARSLNLSVTVLLFAAFVLILRRRHQVQPVQWRRAGAILLILALAQTIWFAGAAWQWNRYLALVRREVSADAGLRRFESTSLNRELVDDHPVAAMNWGWTMPTMSILLAPDGVVGTIIANPETEHWWQPFDPTRLDSLPQLERYGIDYRPYRAAFK